MHSLHRRTSSLSIFSIIFCLLHIFDIFYEVSTVKLHRYWFIDVAKSIWEFWNSQWYYMMWFVFSFVIAKLKHKIFVSWCIFYSILDIDFRIDVSFHENSKHDRNFSDVRSHVFQFDFTSYLKSLDYRISIRSFLQSSYRCMILDISRWESLLESFKQHIVEKVLKYSSLKKFQNSTLKKFARKFQIELVKIQSKRHKRLLWKNVEIQFSQICCANVAIKIQLI